MRLISTLACIAAIAAAPVSAQAFRADNRVIVTPQSDGLFSVPSSGRFGARGAWCAAADYALDVLNSPDKTRLYVRVPKATNSGPVVFGTTPGSTTPTAVSGTTAALSVAGSNLSVGHAYQFCHDALLINSR